MWSSLVYCCRKSSKTCGASKPFPVLERTKSRVGKCANVYIEFLTKNSWTTRNSWQKYYLVGKYKFQTKIQFSFEERPPETVWVFLSNTVNPLFKSIHGIQSEQCPCDKKSLISFVFTWTHDNATDHNKLAVRDLYVQKFDNNFGPSVGFFRHGPLSLLVFPKTHQRFKWIYFIRPFLLLGTCHDHPEENLEVRLQQSF